MKGRSKWIALLSAVLLVTPLAVWASDRFEDVPDSNVFHDDISWLADSGVTFGCNPPDNTQFCPSENVTREQMAAFMRRLSEGQVVDAATAVEADHATTADSATESDHAADSDQLGGEPPTAYQTVVSYFDCGFVGGAGTNCSTSSIPATTNTLIGETAIEAPADGVTELTGTIGAQTTATSQLVVWVTTDAACGSFTEALGGKLGVTSSQGAVETVDVSVVDVVPAGSKTYRLCARTFGTAAAKPVFEANLYARWTEAPPSAVTHSEGDVTQHSEGGIDG
ncbi:MAG: hypothetical protein GEU79_14785 [Acidimicrobiia bacterium]|nr:hypothetical protein [Acidimicrobiia bacterium]